MGTGLAAHVLSRSINTTLLLTQPDRSLASLPINKASQMYSESRFVLCASLTARFGETINASSPASYLDWIWVRMTGHICPERTGVRKWEYAANFSSKVQ